jgi:hypothetical protein
MDQRPHTAETIIIGNTNFRIKKYYLSAAGISAAEEIVGNPAATHAL